MTVALPVQGSVSLSILPQAVWADNTQLPAPPLPVIQDPFDMPPSVGGSQRETEEEKGGTTLGTSLPL